MLLFCGSKGSVFFTLSKFLRCNEWLNHDLPVPNIWACPPLRGGRSPSGFASLRAYGTAFGSLRAAHAKHQVRRAKEYKRKRAKGWPKARHAKRGRSEAKPVSTR